MKRIICLASMSLLLTACGENESKEEQSNSSTELVKEEGEMEVSNVMLGKWQGMIDIPQAPLEIILTLGKDKGSMSVPVQGLTDLPFESIKYDDTSVAIQIDLAGSLIKIDGELVGDQIIGTFMQNGQSFPLKLKIYKEQPLSYDSLAIPVKGGDLKVALQMPEQPTGEIVIIHAGSGPTNKDGNTLGGGSNNSLKMIAEELAEQGIASIRFDKRGIGENRALLTKEENLVLEAYVEDVESIIDYVKEDDRFNKIHLIGHSEGALIMTLVAHKVDIASLTLLAGAGRAADIILNEQLTSNLPPNLLTEAKATLEKLKAGEKVTNVSAELQSLFRPSVQPYLISWLKYAPQNELSKVKVPVLIIQGENDIQVTKEDGQALKAAKPDATVYYFEKMNHVLKDVSVDREENVASYSNPSLPLESGLIEKIVQFIK